MRGGGHLIHVDFNAGPPCPMTSADRTLNDGIPPSPAQKTTALPLGQPPLWRGLVPVRSRRGREVDLVLRRDARLVARYSTVHKEWAVSTSAEYAPVGVSFSDA